jgi:CrcB protein
VKEAGLVMLGGAGGALARYGLQLIALRLGFSSQIGILAVNVSGSFALGLLLSLWLAKTSYPPGLQLLLAVGFLGSFTTFSTLMWESFRLAQNDSVLMALLNLSGSVAAGLAAVALGFLAGRLIGQVA